MLYVCQEGISCLWVSCKSGTLKNPIAVPLLDPAESASAVETTRLVVFHRQKDTAGGIENAPLQCAVYGTLFREQEIGQIAGRYLAKIRTARIDAPLRYAAMKNARIIDTVKQGQQVTVVETWHKYLLIVYIDTQTQEPKSGFVLKKYFR